jgi:hypothetical protein
MMHGYKNVSGYETESTYKNFLPLLSNETLGDDTVAISTCFMEE